MRPSGSEIGAIEAARGTAVLTPSAVTQVHALGGTKPWAPHSDASTAARLAKYARISAEDILRMRHEGRSWGAIKRALGISLPEVPPDDDRAAGAEPEGTARPETRVDVLA